jgi:hypothetical protein
VHRQRRSRDRPAAPPVAWTAAVKVDVDVQMSPRASERPAANLVRKSLVGAVGASPFRPNGLGELRDCMTLFESALSSVEMQIYDMQKDVQSARGFRAARAP